MIVAFFESDSGAALMALSVILSALAADTQQTKQIAERMARIIDSSLQVDFRFFEESDYDQEFTALT
jgi:hypothetical protein